MFSKSSKSRSATPSSSRQGSPARGSPSRGSPAPARGSPPRGTPPRGSPSRGTPRGSPSPARTYAFVALYKVYDERDPNHWALWLSGAAGDVILQVEDDKHGVGYYVAKPLWGKKPQNSSRCMGDPIRVGTIMVPQEEAVDLIQSNPVDNNSKTWNCQAWVVEALDSLEHMGAFVWDSGARSTLVGRRQNWQ